MQEQAQDTPQRKHARADVLWVPPAPEPAVEWQPPHVRTDVQAGEWLAAGTELPCLSLQTPFAELVVNGLKGL